MDETLDHIGRYRRFKMNRSLLAAAIAAASIFIAGCEEQEPTPEEKAAYINSEAEKQVRAQVSADETELKTALVQMQSVDPSIKDIYYGLDDKGNRVLHVVHQNDKPSASTSTAAPSSSTPGQTVAATSDVSDMVWPMVGGMAAGALAVSMMKSGSFSSFASNNPPASSRVYREEERRKERNVATSGYVNTMMGGARSSVTRNPNFGSSMRSSVIGSRSSGIFSSSSSARAGGYSAGS
jgi:hypothetical protein